MNLIPQWNGSTAAPLFTVTAESVCVCKKRCWLRKEQSALKLWHLSPDRREEEEIKQQPSHLTAPTHPQVRSSVFVVCSKLRASVMTRGETRFAQRKQQMEVEAVMSPPGTPRWRLSEVTHFYSCHLSRPNTQPGVIIISIVKPLRLNFRELFNQPLSSQHRLSGIHSACLSWSSHVTLNVPLRWWWHLLS